MISSLEGWLITGQLEKSFNGLKKKTPFKNMGNDTERIVLLTQFVEFSKYCIRSRMEKGCCRNHCDVIV